MQLLMAARFVHGKETALVQGSGVHHMLGGAGRKIAGHIQHQRPARSSIQRGAGHQIPRLIQAGHLHGDHAVAARITMTDAHSHGHGLVDGPACLNHVLHLRQPLVDDLGAGRAGITVGCVDACTHAARGKGYISLKHLGTSGLGCAQFSHVAHGVLSVLPDRKQDPGARTRRNIPPVRSDENFLEHFAIEHIRGPGPVSYTHLDVYKRQAVIRASSSGTPSVMNSAAQNCPSSSA